MCKESCNLTAIFLKDLCPPWTQHLLVCFFLLEDTGNKFSLCGNPIWLNFINSSFLTDIFFKQKSSDQLSHCSYSTPLASMLKTWSADKCESSGRTALTADSAMSSYTSFEVSYMCFSCPCAKEAQWTWHHIHSHKDLGNAYTPAERKAGEFLETLPDYSNQFFLWSNYSEPYSEL